MVDPNGIGTKSLHETSIELALVCIDERIIFLKLVGNTCNEKIDQLPSWGKGEIVVNPPLMKNCSPSLVKNFDPTAEMVGIAATCKTRAMKQRTARQSLVNMMDAGEVQLLVIPSLSYRRFVGQYLDKGSRRIKYGRLQVASHQF